MKYTTPEMEIVMFEAEEIITASNTETETTTKDTIYEDGDL